MRRLRQFSVFRERVYAILRSVPRGKVVTYGQLALMAGRPRAAREVGWIAHAGLPGLAWQRVVNRLGKLASGYRDGRRGHKRDLEREGVRVGEDFTVDLARYQWWPGDSALRRVNFGHESSLAVRTRRRRVPRPRPARRRRSGRRS
jgi:methylated-DNA-protein-cysteine methyltransferase related protein